MYKDLNAKTWKTKLPESLFDNHTMVNNEDITGSYKNSIIRQK